MPLARPGETPQFFEYAVKYALRPKSGSWPQLVKNFEPKSITIPPYQRRIVWREYEIREFLKSESILFGTVILATAEQNELILLDGLQRFATATAILHYLYHQVMVDDPPKSNVAEYFQVLKSQMANRQPIIEYNHDQMSSGEDTRTGIKDSYQELYKKIKLVIDDEMKKPEELAEKIINTFVRKQIAIDTYYGFKDKRELIQTFININSTGMDLKEVDLLRSKIIQQAESMNWDDDVINDIENKFTSIFQKVKGSKVLGKHLYDAVMENGTYVFKNWESLKKEDVENLLDFIDKMYDAALKKDDDQKNLVHPYLYEILQCGYVPFTITTWFFYKKMLEKGLKLDAIDDGFYTISDLHILLRSFYRCVIDGSISYIGPKVSNFMQKNNDPVIMTVKDLANDINPIGGLDSDPEEGEIKLGLRKARSDRARLIFNACLLPNRDDDSPEFYPLRYGSRNDDWSMDHLIPQIEKEKNQRGNDEFDKIMNFAPLTQKLNKSAKGYPCHRKIGPSPDGVYVEVCDKHPYIDWLINEHYAKYGNKKLSDIPNKFALESQELLVVNSDPPIGDDRISKIAELLKNKL